MLVLSRKVGETIQIGEDIFVTVLLVDSGRVRIGVRAPRHVPVDRAEVAAKKAGRKPGPEVVGAVEARKEAK